MPALNSGLNGPGKTFNPNNKRCTLIHESRCNSKPIFHYFLYETVSDQTLGVAAADGDTSQAPT